MVVKLGLMKISVLGIGTELTDGQISNKNDQWISQQMKSLGVSSTSHVVVPDEKHLMLTALKFCAEHSDVVFVTGGLGPTSDDFTRDVIAEWCGKKLIWDEKSWKHIEERLLPRGIAVKEIQRQQCYFPEGSRVLLNRLGTANAFSIRHSEKDIYVLPGPPREIEAIWQDWISAEMKNKSAHLDPLVTSSWDTIGVGESDVADLVVQALKNQKVEIGYRVHLPFVEVKITFPKSNSSQAETWKKSLESAIGSITVLRDAENSAQDLSQRLSAFPKTWICDSLPGSFLMIRLFPFSKSLFKHGQIHFLSENPSRSFPRFAENQKTGDLILALWQDSPGHARASLHYKGQKRIQSFESPYHSELMREREFQYFSEMAMIFWNSQLQNL